jgi:hypothetical protein
MNNDLCREHVRMAQVFQLLPRISDRSGFQAAVETKDREGEEAGLCLLAIASSLRIAQDSAQRSLLRPGFSEVRLA